MSERPVMSRAVRTARGSFGALAATLLAAASHGLAGGTITPLAVAATSILALPLCVLLAGRTGSLWRLALAVAPAQFMFHWSFAGLGAAQGSGTSRLGSGTGDITIAPHAHHLAALGFTPTAIASGNADSLMWALHAVAAICTIALLHFGERGAMHLARVLGRSVPTRVPAAVRLPARPAILAIFTSLPSLAKQVFLTAISHRGPPSRPAFAF